MKALHPTPESLTDLYRLYLPEEAGKDGYPIEWHHTIKHAVRAAAGHRCERCKHPYRNGEHGRGEWSPCDGACQHQGPVRIIGSRDGELTYYHGPIIVDPEMGGGTASAGEVALPPGPDVEAQWRILTVHHLDGDKLNCRWWNLAALCQRCHLEIQGRVRMGQVYPFEHSPWFRIHAAGYYALTYLGEDLSREETLARQIELLALERLS